MYMHSSPAKPSGCGPDCETWYIQSLGIISVFHEKTEVNEVHLYVLTVSYHTINYTIICVRREELTFAHEYKVGCTYNE